MKERIRRMPTFQQATEALEALKVRARKRYKDLAFQWHPDRNPDNQEATEKFKALRKNSVPASAPTTQNDGVLYPLS